MLARRSLPSLRSAAALFILLASASASAANYTVYSESLSAAWADWSWDVTRNLTSTAQAHGGTHAIAATYTAAWGGLYLAASPAVAGTTDHSTLEFWIHGGTAGGQNIQVSIAGTAVAVPTPAAGTWTHVSIPLTDLGSPTEIGDITFQDGSGGSQPTFYLDDIVLTGAGVPPPPPGAGPLLQIEVLSKRRYIDPGVYGMNFADEALATELALPVRRWGGNSTSRYNWQVGVTNTGSDYYYENIPDDVANVGALPNGTSTDLFVEQDRRTGTRSLLTVPLIGWVAKTSSPRNHPFACGFKVSKYGAQTSTDSWDADCGSGVNGSGEITGNDPTDTSMTVGSSFVSDWVAHLVGRYGTAANGGVAYYNLDNEPMLWNSTHRDVHPQPTTYDELRDKTYSIAAAVKGADPSAKTLGPVLWGWCAYLYSAADDCGRLTTDYANHGNTYFVPWYLQQMRAYDQAHKTRLLDYLDLHYYPQASGVSLASAGGAATQALRLRSTKALWDPAYKDESWISDTESGGVAIQLIPRMRDWVSANYPGTKLAVTEYNWGGLEHINGALAQADVLGIFGREGMGVATLWAPPTTSQPGAYAFRMYRNYNGNSGRYGDFSVKSVSADQDKLAVYAARRGSDHAVTVMVINKTASDLTSTVNLAGLTPKTTAAVYRYGASNLNAIAHLADQAATGSGFSATFAANSITLVELKPATAPTSFGDVPAGYWAKDFINGLYANGITTGCGTGTYCPTQNVTRDQMAAFIIRAVEGEPAACTVAPFTDVPTDNAFCKYISRMKALNITTGCSGSNYCPSQNVTRDQMAAFIIRAVEGNPVAGYCGSTAPFGDVSALNGFCGHIKRMSELNITTGCGNGNYCPSQTVSRDQMAAFLARAFLGM
jgi:hypothetical protein